MSGVHWAGSSVANVGTARSSEHGSAVNWSLWPVDGDGVLRLQFVDTLQPRLTPEGVDRAWTKHPSIAVVRLAPDVVENDGVALELDQFSGAFIDDLRHAGPDPVGTSAIGDFFGIE